jgi:lysophospholipase L1-like esterase
MASILCFGDSITQGYVDLEGGWTQRLRRRSTRTPPSPMGATTFPAHAVFNLGVSGDTAEGLLARLEPELGPRRLGDQTIVVVAVGVNETTFDLRDRPRPRAVRGHPGRAGRHRPAPHRPGPADRAAALDHVLAVGIDLRQPDGRLRDPPAP